MACVHQEALRITEIELARQVAENASLRCSLTHLRGVLNQRNVLMGRVQDGCNRTCRYKNP